MQGAGCAGSVGNRIGQLAPCAWRLSKQPGVVQGCRNGASWRRDFSRAALARQDDQSAAGAAGAARAT